MHVSAVNLRSLLVQYQDEYNTGAYVYHGSTKDCHVSILDNGTIIRLTKHIPDNGTMPLPGIMAQ